MPSTNSFLLFSFLSRSFFIFSLFFLPLFFCFSSFFLLFRVFHLLFSPLFLPVQFPPFFYHFILVHFHPYSFLPNRILSYCHYISFFPSFPRLYFFLSIPIIVPNSLLSFLCQFLSFISFLHRLHPLHYHLSSPVSLSLLPFSPFSTSSPT